MSTTETLVLTSIGEDQQKSTDANKRKQPKKTKRANNRNSFIQVQDGSGGPNPPPRSVIDHDDDGDHKEKVTSCCFPLFK